MSDEQLPTESVWSVVVPTILRVVIDQEGQRELTVKAEIGRLVSVLKNSESQVFESIRDEMIRLESERRELEINLRELQDMKTPLDEVTALAKTFIQNWQGIGELLQDITGNERRTLLEHYVEVIQLTPTSEDAKAGTDAVRLFPEAIPVRRTKNSVTQEKTHLANQDPVLSGSSLVRQVSDKAPRLGLEPRT